MFYFNELTVFGRIIHVMKTTKDIKYIYCKDPDILLGDEESATV